MSIKEEAMKLRDEGYTQTEIANMFGVSRQYICQLTGQYDPCHFKRFTEKQVVYPNLRKWLNEHKYSRAEILRCIGLQYHTASVARLNSYLPGTTYPRKTTIDKLLDMTGMTYEELFDKEGG